MLAAFTMAPESESHNEPQRSTAPSDNPAPAAEPAKTKDVPDGESGAADGDKKRKFDGGRGGRGGRGKRGGRGGRGGGRKHEFTHKEAR